MVHAMATGTTLKKIAKSYIYIYPFNVGAYSYIATAAVVRIGCQLLFIPSACIYTHWFMLFHTYIIIIAVLY